MLRFGGDARKLLNILELVVESKTENKVVITDEIVTELAPQNPLAYDKDGEMHYDIISAFIKSIREVTPTVPFTGWRVWWKAVKIRLLLPADWLFRPPKTSGY